jgi:hypothetical protein
MAGRYYIKNAVESAGNWVEIDDEEDIDVVEIAWERVDAWD